MKKASVWWAESSNRMATKDSDSGQVSDGGENGFRNAIQKVTNWEDRIQDWIEPDDLPEN